MHFMVLAVLAFLWLLIFWIGSIALEATGIQRSKARFQVLSAITGTGFTTSEAESVVNNPKRRKIITWLILIGNTGIIAFIIGLLLFIRVGVKSPTPLQIAIIVMIIIAIFGLVKLGFIDMITNAILNQSRKKRDISHLLSVEVLHKAGDYSVMRIEASEGSKLVGSSLQDSGLMKRGVSILAIERGGVVLSFPKAEETMLNGDYILCYGKEVIANIV